MLMVGMVVCASAKAVDGEEGEDDGLPPELSAAPTSRDNGDPISASLSNVENPTAPRDEIRASHLQWADRISVANNVDELDRPEGIVNPPPVLEVTEVGDPAPIGSRLQPPRGPHLPPRLTLAGSRRIERPEPIPVGETLESEILSPLLDPAQLRMERMVHQQAEERRQEPSQEVGDEVNLDTWNPPSHISLQGGSEPPYSTQQAVLDGQAAQANLQAGLAATPVVPSPQGQGGLAPPALEITNATCKNLRRSC